MGIYEKGLEFAFQVMGRKKPVIGEIPITPESPDLPNEHFYANRLKDYIDSLARAYGPRDGTYWLPPETAAWLIRYWQIQIKPPAEITRYGEDFLNPLREILRQMRELLFFDPQGLTFNPKSLEIAPTEVATKAPDIFSPSVDAGRPDPHVMTYDATTTFFNLTNQLVTTMDEAKTKAQSRERRAEAEEQPGTNWFKIAVVGAVIVGGAIAIRQLFMTGQEGVAFYKSFKSKQTRKQLTEF